MIENDQSTEECPLSIDQHLDQIDQGLRLAGTSSNCENVYKALVELAEVYRLVHEWKSYAPVIAPRAFFLYQARKQLASGKVLLAQGPGTLQ